MTKGVERLKGVELLNTIAYGYVECDDRPIEYTPKELFMFLAKTQLIGVENITDYAHNKLVDISLGNFTIGGK